jgi:hypothetical protein
MTLGSHLRRHLAIPWLRFPDHPRKICIVTFPLLGKVRLAPVATARMGSGSPKIRKFHPPLPCVPSFPDNDAATASKRAVSTPFECDWTSPLARFGERCQALPWMNYISEPQRRFRNGQQVSGSHRCSIPADGIRLFATPGFGSGDASAREEVGRYAGPTCPSERFSQLLHVDPIYG